MIIPVILCGGSGTGLWPVSRELYPKQLMALLGGQMSLLQDTVRRAADVVPGAQPIVVCNENQRFMVAAQLQALDVQARSIILEARGRNTAPAIAAAALEAMGEGEDPLLLVLPADHFLADTAPLAASFHCARYWADRGEIVAFGIKPTAPETGYGYVKQGEVLPMEGETGGDQPQAFRIAAFAEKPDRDAAGSFLASGQYLWNSGMFLFRSSTYLKQLGQFAPRIAECCTAAHARANRDLDFLRLDGAALETCPSSSIDRALMEKIGHAVVVSLDVAWRDLGAWSDLHEVLEKDPAGNVLVGDVIAEHVRHSYLHATNRMIAAAGVSDLVVVETKDAVLVAPLDRVQEVKDLVGRLQAEGREEVKVHSRVYRPWGSYESIDLGDRFQVKRITVNPGAKLSLQKHYHRAEHWVVVKGTARITKDREELFLSENQSTYVPLGMLHRLENPGRIPLELIEVQTGSYLKEDDIERRDDVYGRLNDKS
jgi:mannose-1-phosphate guanylyltransferase / mannose-6-phosphate isomerase